MRAFILLLVCLVSLPVHSARILPVASGEYPPFSGKSLPHEGYISHLVTLAYEQQGITVEYHYMPWARSLEEAARGHYPATIFWFCTKERQLDFYCSQEAIETESVNIFHRADTELGKWQNYKDLKRFKFGLTRGYAYQEDFLADVDAGSIRAEFVVSDRQNMRKLLAGRVDLFLIGREAGLAVLKEHFTAEEQARIVVAPVSLSVSSFHVLFSKKSPEALKLRDEFDRGMRRLRALPDYDEVRERFELGGYNSR